MSIGVDKTNTYTANHLLVHNCFVTYFDTETEKWVLLDTSFYPKTIPISERKDYKDENLYKSIWFSFNDKHSYGALSDIRKLEKFSEVVTSI